MAKYKFFIDDTEVGVSELLSVLGVDRTLINKKSREFEINPQMVKRDKQGNPKFPRALGIGTKITVHSKKYDRNVDVRIVETVKKRESRSGFVNVYSPQQIFIHGRYRHASNYEEFIWMMINPDSEGSPFRAQNARWRYRFVDVEAIDSAEIEAERIRIRAMSLIVGDNAYTITQLRQIAKGMNIPNVDDMAPDSVRKELRKIAVQNPVAFYNACTGKEVVFNGMVQDAIDRGVLELKSSDGLRRWVFENEELGFVQANSDSVTIIRNIVLERAAELIPRIKDALNKKSTTEVLNNKNLDGLFDDFIPKDERENLPPVPPAKEVLNATAETNKELAKENRMMEYINYLDYNEEQIKSLHHTKQKFLNENREEIKAFKDKLTEQYV